MSNETIIFFELAVGFIISTTIHRIMQKNVPRSSKRNLLKREQRMLLREINALIEARLKQLQVLQFIFIKLD